MFYSVLWLEAIFMILLHCHIAEPLQMSFSILSYEEIVTKHNLNKNPFEGHYVYIRLVKVLFACYRIKKNHLFKEKLLLLRYI